MSKKDMNKDGGIIKNDLLGSDEFKKSKIGYFLGVSAIPKIVRGTFSPILSGVGIFSKFFKMVLPRKYEKTELSYIEDDSDRFMKAMGKFSISEDDLPAIEKRNKYSAILYFLLSLVALFWGNYVISSDSFRPSWIFDYVFPFFPLFAVVPLFLKHSFWRYQISRKKLISFREFASNPLNWVPFDITLKGPKNAKLTSLVILTASFGLLFANSAFAFSITDTLDENDLFYQLLQFIAPIGPVETSTLGESPWSGPLGAAFRAFNTTLLTVGSMMLGWHTIAGTVASAYEGQVMGQRWHTIWAPVRVTAGIGSLAPVASGFCAAQVLVMQLIVWGGGIANEVWSGYLGYFDSTAAFSETFSGDSTSGTVSRADVVSLSRNQDAKAFIMGVLQKEVCVAGLQEVYRDSANNLYPGVPLQDLSTEQLATVTSGIVNRGWFGRTFNSDSFEASIAERILAGPTIAVEQSGESLRTERTERTNNRQSAFEWQGTPVVVMDYGSNCGSISIIMSDMDYVNRYINQNEADSLYADSNSYINELGQIDDSANREIIENLNNSASELAASLAAIRTNILSGMAREFVEASKGNNESLSMIQSSDFDVMLAQAFTAYRVALIDTTIRNIGHFDDWTTTSDGTSLITAMQEKGWAASGAFYVLLAKIQQMTTSIGNYTPSIEAIDVESIINEHENAQDILIGGNQQSEYGIFPLYDLFAETAFKSNSDIILDDVLSVEDDPSSYLKYVTSIFVNSLYDAVFTSFNPDPYNAMLYLSDMGHKIVVYATNAVLLFLGAGTLLSIVSNKFGFGLAGRLTGRALDTIGVGSISEALAPLMTVVKLALFIVFGVAVVHAYVLPMMPFILMTFFVMGMLVLVAEALVAAPIWAFFHVRLDGQDFVDQVQRPGYMIAFNLLLRPSLAVFGLILSFTIFGSIIWFINETFAIAGKSLMIGDHSSIVGGIVMLVLLTYLHYQVAVRSFTLITQVPDRVTRWFGQGGENLGEQGDAEKQTSIIASQATNRAEGMSKGVGLSSMGGGAAKAVAPGVAGAGAAAAGKMMK